MIVTFEEMISILVDNAPREEGEPTPAEAFSVHFQEGNPPKLATTRGYETTDLRTVHLYLDQDGRVYYLAIG